MKTVVLFSMLSLMAPAVCAADSLTVAAQLLPRGTVIGAADLVIADAAGQPRRIGVLDSKALLGMELRRSISPGQPIYGQDIQPPTLVRRNQIVTLVISRGELSIAASGKALGDGAKGSTVRVQNVASRQIIEGEVAADGVVRVAALSAPQIPAGF